MKAKSKTCTFRKIYVALVTTVFFTSTQVAADSSHFEAEDVFELEYATDPQIAPDGSRLLYVRRSNDIMTDNTRSNIWSVNLDGTDHRPLLSGASNFSSPR